MGIDETEERKAVMMEKQKWIFLHGLGQTSQSWAKTIENLDDVIQAETIELFQSPELSSDKPLTYEALYHAFAIECQRRKEPQEKVWLCGLSLGAILALNYVLDFPEQVAGCILIAPQIKPPKFLLTVQDKLFCLMPQKVFTQLGLTKKDFLSCTRSMRNLNFASRISSIEWPVAVVCGQKDKVNQKAMVQFRQLNPKVSIHFIEDAGHEVNEQQPEALANLLTSMIQSQ